MKMAFSSSSLRNRFAASRRRLAVWGLLAVSFVATAASALAGYAAIAFDQKTGKWGEGHGYTTRAEAEARAIEECNSPNAKIVMWANEGVIALALGDTRGAYGTGRDNRRKVAQNQAVDNCAKYSENAHVVVTVDTEE